MYTDSILGRVKPDCYLSRTHCGALPAVRAAGSGPEAEPDICAAGCGSRPGLSAVRTATAGPVVATPPPGGAPG